MKQKLVQKQKQMKDVEKQINKLKNKLLILTERYTYEVYQILNQIYELRKSQIKNYSIFTLTQENGISFDDSQIQYIFGYKHFTNKAWKMVNKSKITPKIVLSIIKKNVKFRETKNQDDFLEKYENGEVNSTEIKELNSNQLFQRVKTELHIDEDKKAMLRSVYQLKSLAKNLIKYKKLFKLQSNKDMLKENHKLLNKAVKSVLK